MFRSASSGADQCVARFGDFADSSAESAHRLAEPYDLFFFDEARVRDSLGGKGAKIGAAYRVNLNIVYFWTGAYDYRLPINFPLSCLLSFSIQLILLTYRAFIGRSRFIVHICE